VVDHPCGPFAGIETAGASMPGRCLHMHGADDAAGPSTTVVSKAVDATSLRRNALERYLACMRLRGVSVPNGSARVALTGISFRDPATRTAHDNCSALMPPTIAGLLGLN
jgi:hypothetical protein